MSNKQADCSRFLTATSPAGPETSARLSAWIYTLAGPPPCYHYSWELIQRGDAVAAVLYREDCLIVVYRGTVETRTWLTNLDGGMAELLGGQVWEGFAEYESELHQRVSKIYQQEQLPTKFCGHSLGGAAAIISAARFASGTNGDLVDTVHTFGCPAVGDANFSASLRSHGVSSRISNFVNPGDGVPRVPPWLVHPGQILLWDDAKSSWQIQSSVPPIVERPTQAAAWMSQTIKNHDVNLYVSRFE